MQNSTAILEDSLAISYKTKATLTIQWSNNHSACYLPKGVEDLHSCKTCTWKFRDSLFTTAKTWKQPRRPSVGEWIEKLQYIETMAYYSALKRNELSSHEKTCMNLKDIWLSERSQSEKTAYRMILNIWYSRISKYSGRGKMIETIKRSMVGPSRWWRSKTWR